MVFIVDEGLLTKFQTGLITAVFYVVYKHFKIGQVDVTDPNDNLSYLEVLVALNLRVMRVNDMTEELQDCPVLLLYVALQAVA